MAISSGLSVGGALKILFHNASKQATGLQAAVAFDSISGEVIASYSIEAESEKEAYRLLSESVRQTLERVAREYSTGGSAVSFFDTNTNRLIFLKASNLVLCFVLNLDSNLDQVLPVAYVIAEKIVRVIAGDNIDLSIPILDPNTAEIQQAYQVKLVVIGDAAVGKTSLIHRYSKKAFKENFLPTLGVSITTNHVDVAAKNSIVKFAIWDFGGQEYLRRVRQNYYYGAKACFLVFDLTNSKSFEDLMIWEKEKLEFTGEITTIILGNKSDLVDKRAVDRDIVLAFANSRGYSYLETSALTGSNVNDAFNLIAYKVIDQEAKR